MATSIERINFSNILLPVVLLAAVLVATSSTPRPNTTSSHDSIEMLGSLDDTTPAPGAPCGMVNCLQGTCKSTDSMLGFECECYQGWMKPFGLPFCALPNCSINMACRNESLPPPPPAAPVPLPLPFTPCFLVWCGDGQCVPGNGTTNHTCECNDGSTNLLDKKGLPNKGLPCLKKCNFGADCSVQIGPHTMPPPPSLPPPPSPPHFAAAPGNGPSSLALPSSSWNYKALSTMLVAAIILTWI